MTPARWISAVAGQFRDLPVAVAGLVYGFGLFVMVALVMVAISGPSARPLDVLVTLLIAVLGGMVSAVIRRRRSARSPL